MNEHDIRFMEHALALARNGVGLASPNPTVGCVVVRDGEIVGEGFHEYDKRDHAEIVALRQAGGRSRGATLYATLEPCNHTGRTGPCTEAILAAGISRVVAAIEDPNPKVAGGGFERLRAAGVEVIVGACEQEARRLNEAFAGWIRTGKPFVTLKSALTLDGQLAMSPQKGSRKREWITSEESRAEVHRMRHASDALLTGIGTVLADNPLLTDRSGLPRRRKLLRCILDSKLRLPTNSNVAQSAQNDLLVFTSSSLKLPKAKNLQKAGVELVHLGALGRRSFLLSALKELGRREMQSVLLEAGPTLNGAALAAKAVDKLVLFYAPKFAGAAGVPLMHESGRVVPQARVQTIRQFGPDLAVEMLLNDPFTD
jgi:diaminohydroxyphosphoribosylaminopyrimidine deaminase/5-amino-6-(5-phosphoribosylamino)uracil reductase